ncbi:MAG: hypothetical protein WBP43_01050 [Chitinophagales bacterium]
MKHLFKLFIGLMVLCSACNVYKSPPPPQLDINTKFDPNCAFNGNLNSKQRSRIFPFNKSEKIVIVSFDVHLGKLPVVNNIIDTAKISEYIILNNAQNDSLTNILLNFNYPVTNTISVISESCYDPRHAILFYNKHNDLIAYLELCFSCGDFESNFEADWLEQFCSGKYDLLESFFVEAGITYFGNAHELDIIIKEKK